MGSYIDLPILPDEILLAICQELGNDREFGTLHNCALTARLFATPAIRVMYQ